MRTDICDASDSASLTRLREALHSLGAVPDGDIPAPGIQFLIFRIADEKIVISADESIVDIDGPLDVVERVIAFMNGLLPRDRTTIE